MDTRAQANTDGILPHTAQDAQDTQSESHFSHIRSTLKRMDIMMTSHEELFIMNGDFVDAKTTEKNFRKAAGIVLVSLVLFSAAFAMEEPWEERSLLFNRFLQVKGDCSKFPSGCSSSSGSDDALFNRRLESKNHNHDHDHGHNSGVDDDDDDSESGSGKGKGKGGDDAFRFYRRSLFFGGKAHDSYSSSSSSSSDDALLFYRRLQSKGHNHDSNHDHDHVNDISNESESGKGGKGKGSDDAFIF